MTFSLVAFSLAAFLAIAKNHLLAGVALLVGVATLAVQWLCIEPPGVEDRDLH
jgi:hypothetical protein